MEAYQALNISHFTIVCLIDNHYDELGFRDLFCGILE